MKKSILYLLLFLFVVSCSSDEWASSGKVENGKRILINFNLEIPELEVAASRAVDENSIAEACVMVIDSTSNELKQHVMVAHISGSSFSASVDFESNCKLYVVTNANELIQGLLPEDEEESVFLSNLQELFIHEYPDTTIPMWGSRALTEEEKIEIVLRRIVAKFTIETGQDQEGRELAFELESFSLVHVADSASILVDEEEPGDFPQGGDSVESEAGVLYAFPTRAGSDTHILVKGKYDGKETGYYRLNLSGDAVYPNYWYQITITSVTGPGFSTPEEASRSLGDTDMECFIDEHAYVTNMITNGEYQLGVENQILLGDHNGNTTETKVVVINKREMLPQARVVSPEEEGSQWFEVVGEGEVMTEEPERGCVTYTFTLRTLSDNRTGKPREGEVELILGNLTRRVKVVQEAINLQKDVDVLFTTVGDYQPLADEPYWEFLKNTVGLDAEYMQGLVRDKGFHFPVNDKEIKLEYKLYLKQEGKYAYTYRNEAPSYLVVSEGSSDDKGDYIKVTLNEVALNQPVFYGIVKNGLILEDEDPNHTVYFDLYFTGIFRQGTGAFQITEEKLYKDQYVYYEAVPFEMKDGSITYWLDRNLCAGSNAFFIKSREGNVLYGDPAAAGGIYKIANTPVNHEVVLLDPGPCPPGFSIPTEQDFGEIEKYMRYEQNKEYFWETYLETGYNASDNLLEKVYFPKCMMWYENGIKGTELTGYYWTQSKAVGVSSTERGYWLRHMQLGNSMQYNHFRIWEGDDSSDTSRTGMSLRCIKKGK